MTIDEAIKVDKDMLAEAKRRGLPGRVNALQLDIEALKGIKQLRDWGEITPAIPLPSETLE